MTTTIKITELTNIGANLNGNTLVPVVNMNGTPVTQRSNVDNLANYVLNTGTGANLGPVGNITITGGNAGEVLTTDGNGVLSWEASGLTYSNSNVAAYLPTYTGNISGDYLELTHDVTANVITGNYIYGDASNVTNLPVGTVAFLNTDGNASNVLSGAGTWIAAGGGGNPFNQELNTTDNVVFANVTSTEAVKFSNSSNIVGALGYAPNYVSIEGYGSNTVNITANDVYTWSFGDTGNLTLPGNTFAVNYANGSQVPLGTISSLVNGNNSLVLDGDGNIVLEGTPSGNAINRGLVWDYGANANGVNSTLRQDNGGLTVRAWTENGGGANGYSAPVTIITNQDAAAKNWIFDGDGNLTVPTGSINSINDGGDLGAYITLTPDLGLAKLSARNAQSNVNYTNTSWTSGTYTGTQVDFVDAPDLVTFFNENRFNDGVNQTFSINGDEPIPFTGYTIGVGNAVTVYTSITPEPDPTTVTSINFYYQLESYVSVDYDDGSLNINATGLSIYLDNDQTEGPDIFLRSGDDITLQAKNMSLGSEREGGDINLNAGDGAGDDGTGNTSSTGGDILINAGNGGDGNTNTGSSGGFTIISGGTGGGAGVTSTAGPGGYVSIQGGDGGYDTGNTQLGAGGGYVSITAGLSTQEGVDGPNVTITSGQGGPNALAGSVIISTPASANGAGGDWIFDGDGKLTFPGTPRIDTSTNNFEVQAAQAINFEANTVVNIYTDASGNTYQWQFGDDGNTVLPGNSTINVPAGTGGAAGYNLSIKGGDADQSDYYTTKGGDINIVGGLGASNDGGGGGPGGNINIIAGTSADTAGHSGNISISSGNLDWTFDYTGNLTLPGNTFAVNYANGTPVSIGGGSGNTGNVTFSDNIVIGTGDEYGGAGLYLATGPNGSANLQYLRLRGGDQPTHIHLDTGNNEFYDQYFGDDGKFVKLEAGSFGNVSIGTQDLSNNNIWTFTTDANLILAGGNSVIQSIANSSLDPVNPNVSTMVLTPDSNYYLQALVLDPTAPGHIHLRATASSNIDEPNANLFLGGEDTAFEITQGANNQAVIHSGGNDWVFGNTGNLTLPAISLGSGVDEQTVIQSQRKIIPPYRWSVTITGSTPTVVYSANSGTLTLKTTLVVQHSGLGLEMFDVSAVGAGANVIYSVSNRLNATGQDDTTAVVDWDVGSGYLQITLTINSGATTSWVTYDSTEFGIAVD